MLLPSWTRWWRQEAEKTLAAAKACFARRLRESLHSSTVTTRAGGASMSPSAMLSPSSIFVVAMVLNGPISWAATLLGYLRPCHQSSTDRPWLHKRHSALCSAMLVIAVWQPSRGKASILTADHHRGSAASRQRGGWIGTRPVYRRHMSDPPGPPPPLVPRQPPRRRGHSPSLCRLPLFTTIYDHLRPSTPLTTIHNHSLLTPPITCAVS